MTPRLLWPGRRAGFVLLLIGLAVRFGTIWFTRDQAAHPDFSSFLSPPLGLTHAFDTSPREPFYVWWLWLLGQIGASSFLSARVAGVVWFIPTFLLLEHLAQKIVPERGVFGVLFFYALWPAQVLSDSLGLRHIMETPGLVVLALLGGEKSLDWKSGLARAGALAGLVLTRLNHLTSVVFWVGGVAFRRRKISYGTLLIPSLVLLAIHFHNNFRRTGDPLYSINLHSYWYANLEFAGTPGFPVSQQERENNVYTPSYTYRQWAFGAHTLGQYLHGCLVGYGRFFWYFFKDVYLRVGFPRFCFFPLILLFLWGWVRGVVVPERRALVLFIVVGLFPYAFVGHVFWAGRFFTPFMPMAWVLAVAGGLDLGKYFSRTRGQNVVVKN